MKRLITLTLALTLALPLAAEQTQAIVQRALAAVEAHDFATSNKLLREVVKAKDATTSNLYNAACGFALAGQKEEAFAALTQAVDRGYANGDHIAKDSDLVSLREDPRFQTLIDRARAAIERERKRWNSPTINTPYRENLSEEEKIAGLSRVWSEVRYNFANFDLIPDVDWDALYLAAIPRVRATSSTFDYYNVLIELVAKLRDGHTNAWQPDALTNRVWAIPQIRQRMIDGRIMVARVGDGVETIHVGDEILEVDGMPWKRYAEANVVPYLSASTPQDLAHRTGDRLLHGDIAKAVTLKLRDAKGVVSTIELTRDPRAKRLPNITSSFEYRLLPGNIAYVALNEFDTPKAADEFDAHFDEIAKADALIIDIRNNGGGSTNIGYRVLSTLIDKSVGTTQGQKIAYRPTDRARLSPQSFEFESSTLRPDSKGRHFKKPVAVLLGPGTYSAAEDFLVAWKLSNRGPAIGTASGGSTGQPLSIPLPGGGGMRICTKRDRFVTGAEFVGIGIKPDIEVHTPFEEAQAGRDPVLERARVEVVRAAKK